MKISATLMLVAGGSLLLGAAPRGEDRLARELDGRTAGQPRNCVPIVQNEALRIVDENSLVYREGRTLWVNRLPKPCRGLRPDQTLVVRPTGAQHCRGDYVRSLLRGTTIPTGLCRLGEFTPYQRPR